MKLDSPAGKLHLTYCLNMHPGETWVENFSAIRRYCGAIRDRLNVKAPFGLGLRLSRTAADALLDKKLLSEFHDYLKQANLYVFTINGFPYGRFSGMRLKEQVFAPDWRTPERVEYTIQLGQILAELLPAGVPGSISTSPGSYKAWIKSDADIDVMAQNFVTVGRAWRKLAQETGKQITLGIEPEPDGFVETTQELIGFLTGPVAKFDSDGKARAHLGICLDTCHLAVQFEDLAESINQLKQAGVPIAKVQVSNALRVKAAYAGALTPFAEPVYLHQVRVKSNAGAIDKYPDLSDALAKCRNTDGEWRVHYHVPLYFGRQENVGSTQADLTQRLLAVAEAAGARQFEIETYTFEILPELLGGVDPVGHVAREYAWLLETAKHWKIPGRQPIIPG